MADHAPPAEAPVEEEGMDVGEEENVEEEEGVVGEGGAMEDGSGDAGGSGAAGLGFDAGSGVWMAAAAVGVEMTEYQSNLLLRRKQLQEERKALAREVKVDEQKRARLVEKLKGVSDADLMQMLGARAAATLERQDYLYLIDIGEFSCSMNYICIHMI